MRVPYTKQEGVLPDEKFGTDVTMQTEFEKSPHNGSVSDTNNHLVLLAETTKGYRNLVKLVSAGFLEAFSWSPRSAA